MNSRGSLKAGGLRGQQQRHEKAREAFIYQRSRAFKSGAQEGTRTPKPLGICTSSIRVYQFHHLSNGKNLSGITSCFRKQRKPFLEIFLRFRYFKAKKDSRRFLCHGNLLILPIRAACCRVSSAGGFRACSSCCGAPSR